MPPNPLAHPFAPPLAATAAQTTTSATTTNPTLPTLSAFLLSHFPTLSPQASAAEVPWLYHSPQPPKPNSQTPRPLPSNFPVEKLVLSITPTEGVYTALGAAPPPSLPVANNTGTPTTSSLATPASPTHPPAPKPTRPGTAASFLHRPWTLARARLPRGTAVFSSHKGFDEALTVGCNFALLERLGLEISRDAVEVLVGYKGDEGRRVGVVAGWKGGGGVGEREVRVKVEREFGDLAGEGAWFGFSEDGGEEGGGVKAIACMNAFHAEEVERVANAALRRGYVADAARCEGLVYLTGAVRKEGLRAAREMGMRVVCVGHRRCEVWGVGYLAGRVRERWPGLEVRVVDEEEVKVEKVGKKKGSGRGGKENGNGKGNEKSGKPKGDVGREQKREDPEQKPEETFKKRKVVDDESEDGGVAL